MFRLIDLYGQGFHGYMMDCIELGERVATELDRPRHGGGWHRAPLASYVYEVT